MSEGVNEGVMSASMSEWSHRWPSSGPRRKSDSFALLSGKLANQIRDDKSKLRSTPWVYTKPTPWVRTTSVDLDSVETEVVEGLDVALVVDGVLLAFAALAPVEIPPCTGCEDGVMMM